MEMTVPLVGLLWVLNEITLVGCLAPYLVQNHSHCVSAVDVILVAEISSLIDLGPELGCLGF